MKRVGNIVGKGKIAGFKKNPHFSKWFQKRSYDGSLMHAAVWYAVKQTRKAFKMDCRSTVA